MANIAPKYAHRGAEVVLKAEGNIHHDYWSFMMGPPGSWIVACSEGSVRNLGGLVVSVKSISPGPCCELVLDAHGTVSP
jgi:hypothetical protein